LQLATEPRRVLSFAVPISEAVRVKKAAKKAKQTLSAWLRERLALQDLP
jgi:hypothetical protein